MNEQEVKLAKIGFMALIDEATGYQQERFKDPKALRKEYRRLGIFERDRKKLGLVVD